MNQNSKGKRTKRSRKPSGFLTAREVRILQKQIHANSLSIDRYIHIIDLLANKERCPKDANTLIRFRRYLAVAIAENDTFRKVLWRHAQRFEHLNSQEGLLDAASYLVDRINYRKRALLAQLAMKK